MHDIRTTSSSNIYFIENSENYQCHSQLSLPTSIQNREVKVKTNPYVNITKYTLEKKNIYIPTF